VDVQRRGPYKHWMHTHRFREEQGATIIEDKVQYALPYAPLGETRLPPRAFTVVPDISVSTTRHPGVFLRRHGSALTSWDGTPWHTGSATDAPRERIAPGWSRLPGSLPKLIQRYAAQYTGPG
jgi:hypothetical protein